MARRAAERARAETGDGIEFGKQIEAAVRGEGGASVLLTDLDNLMVLNEKAGREAGDAAIGAAIRVLKAAAERDGYSLLRVGGDEFALLAAGVPLEQAFLRAEKLRAELNAALAKAVPRGYTCTATIGVANAPRDAKGPEQLMRKADLALYAAKEQGGNAVGLTPGDDMVLRSSYYSVAQLGRLRALAERQKKKEAVILREALDDLLRKYERA
jgi:diguanylate cyclase (GGDEF)-like protein